MEQAVSDDDRARTYAGGGQESVVHAAGTRAYLVAGTAALRRVEHDNHLRAFDKQMSQEIFKHAHVGRWRTWTWM